MLGFRRKRVIDPLDEKILLLSEHDPFTLRHLLNGGVAVFGRTGSGKTSSSGRELAEAAVRIPRSGGLILAPKPDDLPMWQRIFAKFGREKDLIVFAPDHPARFNFLNYEMKNGGGQTRGIVRLLTTVGESLRSADTRGGENADFWQRETERLLYNAVEVVKRATGAVDAWDLQQFITGAAQSPEQLKSPDWRDGHHCKLLERARNAPKDALGSHDFALACDYFLGEYPGLADRTRSSIVVGAMGLLHVFNTGVVRELVSTTTTVSPDNALQFGRWILVNMPPPEFGDEGLLVAAGWKYLFQKAVLRRHATPESNVVVVWGDEAPLWCNSFDGPYLAMCRSHRGCMVYLTQSLPSFYERLGGNQKAKYQVDSLLGNFALKIVHTVSCPQTAQWASSLIGRERQAFIGGSTSPMDSLFDQIMGRGKFTGSFSESLTEIVQPRQFMTDLRTGGPANGYMCDAILVRNEPFANGSNWLLTSFSQKG
jgi:hypothetical protein